jgi:hypothetical protein
MGFRWVSRGYPIANPSRTHQEPIREEKRREEKRTLKPILELRIAICANGAPIGPRLQRGEPLPEYQHTYDYTPSGIKQAENDMIKIQAYIDKYHGVIKRK